MGENSAQIIIAPLHLISIAKFYVYLLVPFLLLLLLFLFPLLSYFSVYMYGMCVCRLTHSHVGNAGTHMLQHRYRVQRTTLGVGPYHLKFLSWSLFIAFSTVYAMLIDP